MYKAGFDNNQYLKMQSERIKERISEFGGKLYLEFGGKLFDDYHASRVLPGFEPDSKLQMLLQIKEQAEIVIVISTEDIVNSKLRADLGITCYPSYRCVYRKRTFCGKRCAYKICFSSKGNCF